MNNNQIPAIPYYLIVRQYAEANGLKFFTMKQQEYAKEHYELHAKFLN